MTAPLGLFHPETVATDRARRDGREVTDADFADAWAGRRRMAAARQTAGVPLDALTWIALGLAVAAAAGAKLGRA